MPTGIRRFSARKLFAILDARQISDRDLCRLVRDFATERGLAIRVFPQELSKWKVDNYERNPAEDKLWAICSVLGVRWGEISEGMD